MMMKNNSIFRMGKVGLLKGSAIFILALSMAFLAIALRSSYAARAEVISFDNSTPDFITLEKTDFIIGEQVLISSSVKIDGVLFSLAIISPVQRYVFLGDGNSKLYFTPKISGLYKIELLNSKEEVVYTKEFSVYDYSESVPIKSGIQENISGEPPESENPEKIPKQDALPSSEDNLNLPENYSSISGIKIKNSASSDITSSLVVKESFKGSDLNIRLSGDHFQEMKILQFSRKQGNYSPSLGLEEVLPEKVIRNLPGKSPLKNTVFSYAIDTSSLGSEVTLTMRSSGKELWKCAEWNFSTQVCTGAWVKIMNLVPGENYNVTVNSTDPAFAEIGLSTINTNKSIYHPGETSKIFIVVLNNNGIPVSGAYVNLTVTSPSGISSFFSTENGDIIEERRGVYSAVFSKTFEEGSYAMDASAKAFLTDAEFSSNFSVAKNYPYDILRESTIMLDPKKEYVETALKIVSYSSGTFNLTEEVPDSFLWISGSPDVISYSGGKRILTWVNLSNNSVVKYSIDAPLVWPASYELRARIDSLYDSFSEARPWYVAVDPSSGNAIIAYGIASNNPRYRYWDSSSLSSEASALGIGGNPRWVQMEGNPNSEEIIMGIIDATPSLDVQVWNGTAWTNQKQLTTSVLAAYKGFDVAYEHNSGRAIVAYRDGTNIPKYFIWNGTNWSSAAASAQNTGSAVRWLELASDPNSNYIMMVTADASADSHINVQIWNGTAWLPTVTRLSIYAYGTTRNFDVVWDNSNHSIVAYGSKDAYVHYALYNKSSNSWPVTSGTAISVEPGNNDWPYWIELASSKTEDYIFLAASDDGNDLHAGIFNVTNNTWTNFGRLAGTVPDPTLRNFDVEFESVSGNAILVYGKNGDNVIRYRQWINGYSNISTETAINDVGNNPLWVELAPNPDTNEIMLSTIDDGSDLNANIWDGSSWTNLGELSNGGLTTSALGTDVVYEQKITLPPTYSIWNLSNSSGIIPDYSNQTRGEMITAFAMWNMKINQSYAEHNGLSMLLNFSVNPPFTGFWTNYSFNTSDENTVDRLGLINVSIYAKNFGDVWSAKTIQKHFYLWADLKISSINLSDDVLSINETTTANCQVSDYRINISIASYNISFYVNGTLLGKNTTDSNGWASYSFSRNTSGSYLLICNITGDAANYYRASPSTQNSKNISFSVFSSGDTDKPVINSVISSVEPVPYKGNVTFTANVTDNIAVSSVLILLGGTNRTMSPLGGNLFSYTYDTSALPVGEYTLTVYANDSSNLEAIPHSGTFTITNILSVSVSTDKSVYSGSENVSVNTSVSISGVPQTASVYSDIIFGNATTPWWNSSWKMRKPILLSHSGSALSNVSIRVNVSGLSNISNCSREIRVASKYKEPVAVNVLSGDNANWCEIVFLGNVSSGAVNEHLYDVYFNNSAASDPGYPAIPVVSMNYFYDNYSNGLSNYQNPTDDFSIVSNELRVTACDPSTLTTNPALLNFSGWQRASISFQYREAGTLEADDCLSYGLYSKGIWYEPNTNVFCNDVGATYLNFGINVTNSAMSDDFLFRYNCSGFTGFGEVLYIDNLNITLFNNGRPDIFSSSGSQEQYIASYANLSIGANGYWTWAWNVSGYPEGAYSAVSISNKTAYASGIGYKWFRIASEAPLINSVSSSPEPAQLLSTIRFTANITSSTFNVSDVKIEIAGINYTMSPNGTDVWAYSYDSSSLSAGINQFVVYANNTAGLNAVPFRGNFTLINQIKVKVSSDDTVYNPGTNVSITTNISIASMPHNASVSSDIILGNATTPWWNSSWNLRKPVYISNMGAEKLNFSVRINVTGLSGISNCTQLRVASAYKELTQFNVLNNGSDWCDIIFLANISANAVNEHFYDIYYNNSAAVDPAYPFFAYRTIFYDGYPTGEPLSNYSNPTSDFSIAANELRAVSCNPSALTTNSALLNFSGWQTASISFQYREAGTLEADDCLSYGLYSKGIWYEPNTEVFCDDVGATYLNFGINVTNSAMSDDFLFRYNCSGFTGAGEVLYIDNLNITAFNYGSPNVSSYSGSQERYVASFSNSSTGNAGSWQFAWNTSGQQFGFYSAVSLASLTGFISGYNYTLFQITGNSAPEVSLLSPADGTASSSTAITFNCSAIDDLGLSNITLYGNWTGSWSANGTRSVSGLSSYANFTRPINDGAYIWNCLASDTGNLTAFAPKNYSLIVDSIAPNVFLLSPPNSNFSSSSVNVFMYNVTDANNITFCAFKLDGVMYDNRTDVPRVIPQTFEESIPNGLHNWTVNCTDVAGNSYEAAVRSINVSATPILWEKRWYETSTFNCTDSACNIGLANTRDSAENYAVVSVINASNTAEIVSAISPYLGSNGALIPANTVISFSGEFLSNPANKGQVEWYVYYVSEGTDYLICNSTGNTLSTTVTSSCTSPNYNLKLASTSKLKLSVKVYNSFTSAITVYHYWDNLRLSYMEFGNFTTIGTLSASMTKPDSNLTLWQNELFNETCNVSCFGGACINVRAYAQYNTSASAWVNIGSSGNLILDSGESNPHNLGNLNSSSNTTFSVKASMSSTNNIRCIAVSDYSNASGPEIIQVVVGDSVPPAVSLGNPINLSWSNSSEVIVFYTPSDNTGIANCSLILNSIRNSTNYAVTNDAQNNFTISGLLSRLYNWTVNCTDTSGNSFAPPVKWFYVDTVFPSINLSLPADGASVPTNSVTFNFTVTDNLAKNLSCNLTVDGIVKSQFINATNNTPVVETFTFSSATHYWNVTCADNASNWNTSETRSFTITDTPPVINLIYPPDDYGSTTGNIDFIFNVSENNNITNCSLIINNVLNQTKNSSLIINNAENFFNLTGIPEGIYSWTVNCTDNAGLVGTSDPVRAFYVDTQAPNVSLVAPANYQNFTFSNITLIFNATDRIANNLSCNITVDGFLLYTNLTIQNNSNANRSSVFDDGVHFWNVSCTDYAGNINTSITRSFNVSEKPSVSLTSPAVNSWTNGNVTFIFSAFDNDDLNNCSLILNGAVNQTKNSTELNLGENNFTLNEIPEGTNKAWTVLCYDEGTYSNYYQPASRLFSVDRTAPSIALKTPASNSTIAATELMLYFNATDNYASNFLCNVTVNNNVEYENLSTQSGVLNNASISDLSDGIYYWNVSCLDAVKNLGWSETWNFTIAIPPEVTLFAPLNNTWQNSSSIAFSYFTVDDVRVANCSLYIDGSFNQTNDSIANNDYNYFYVDNIPEGNHTWNVFCSDPSANIGASPVWIFGVDIHAPSIIQHMPENNTIWTSNYVTFNWTAFDNLAENLNCTLYIDNNLKESGIIAQNNTPINRTYLYPDSMYSWNVSCFDLAHNINASELWNFTIKAPPNVTLESPGNNSWGTLQDLTFTYLPEDPIGIRQCVLYLDGQQNATDTNIEANTNNSFLVTGISEGAHTWTVNCTDSDWNTYAPPEFKFYIDTSAPFISITMPSENQNFSVSQAVLNFTAIDNLAPNLTCNITINDIFNRTVTAFNNTPYNFTLIGLSDGVYSLNVSCADLAGNTNTSEVRHFNVSAAPNISLVSPADFSWKSANPIIFYFNASDNDGLLNCSLLINGSINATKSSALINPGQNNITSTLGEGIFNWAILCFDNGTYLNSAVSPSRIIYVDLFEPSVNLLLPENGVTLSNNSPMLNFTASDNISQNLTCNLTIDSIIKDDYINLSSGAVYSREFSNLTSGQHFWNVSCADYVGHIGTSATWNFTVPRPDLTLNTSDIAFYYNTTNPEEGKAVTINATIHNLGASSATNFIVQFFDGEPSLGGLQIGPNLTLSLSPNSNSTLSANWTASLGMHNIFIIIDPPLSTNGSILEENESNNYANQTILIQSWQFIYGNLSGGLGLGSQFASYVYLWNLSDANDSNIFAADSDSSINWSSLSAIGRTILGEPSPADFAAIDSSLSMSAFSDSVNSTYTSGGEPVKVESFNVYGKNIENVPVANSTNNSNFETGILWDYSDGNTYYNATQDLVFVTRANSQAQGRFGTYDYEMRIPSNLKNYKGETPGVSLYLELK